MPRRNAQVRGSDELVVADSKHKRELDISDVGHIVKYGNEIKANRLLLFLSKETIVPTGVREAAEAESVTIRITDWPGTESQS